MKETTNCAVYDGCMETYGGVSGLSLFCKCLGLDGLELIWGDDAYVGETPEALGYHLCFWPDWLDFWRGDEKALLRKFGSREAYTRFYGGSNRDTLMQKYRADMDRAQRLGAEYAVFHVADVSIEEGYTRKWLHSDEQVIDASAELLNTLTDGRDYSFALLLENQWWPGFTFTDPKKTARLLERVSYPNKGVMLDTGHLLNTNPALASEREGIEYICRCLDAHGELCRHIRGVHLNLSLSGEYVRAFGNRLPDNLPEDYFERYRENYAHILRVDEHRPWTDGAIAGIVSRVAPEWLTHELAASCREEKDAVLRAQMETLRKGGTAHGTDNI